MSFSSIFVVSNALRLKRFKTSSTGGGEPAEQTGAEVQIRTGSREADQVSNDNTNKERENEAMITMKINGMMCAHCKAAVEKALGGVAGVEKAEVNLEEKAAYVTGEGVSKDALKDAVTEAGYEVVSVE